MRAFLNGLDEAGINHVYEFKLLSGEPASVFWQMLQHVVNHASYHRGQVTTMLRQLGAQPGKSMDMIAVLQDREVLEAWLAGNRANRSGDYRDYGINYPLRRLSR